MACDQSPRNYYISDQNAQNRHRLRRAESWLELSRKQDISDDEKFIVLWIAFNAAYGDEIVRTSYSEGRPAETNQFMNFLQEIVNRDEDDIIGDCLWNRYSPIIIGLVSNQYVYQPHWDWVRDGAPDNDDWRVRLQQEIDRVEDELKPHRNRNVGTVLRLVFNRLYTLRNQIFHGGTTFATGVGRVQIEDGAILMGFLVPAILDIMRADIELNPESDVWGKIAYPSRP